MSTYRVYSPRGAYMGYYSLLDAWMWEGAGYTVEWPSTPNAQEPPFLTKEK